MSEQKRCMSCMKPVPTGAASCPNCGYNGSGNNAEGFLPIGTRLAKGRFLVGRAASVHPDSVDYAAYDLQQLCPCILREYLPAGGCTRVKGENRLQPAASAASRYQEGLSIFLQFYGKLGDAPENGALQRVYACISQNGTGYAALEDFDGMTLRQLLNRSGGTLTPEQTAMVMAPVLDALQWMHDRALLHRCISPEEILINTNGDVRLTGLCASAPKLLKLATGYASPELAAGEQPTPAGDVYSAAAVYYRCLVGSVPQDALQRRTVDTLAAPAELDSEIPEAVSYAVWHAMLLNPAVRTETVEQFRRQLAGEQLPPRESEEPTLPTSDSIRRAIQLELEPPQQKKSQRWKLWSLISAGLFLVLLAVYFIGLAMSRQRAERHEQQLQEQLQQQAAQENLLPAPDYVGQHISFVKFDVLSFDYVLVPSFREGAADGEVVSQSPRAGTGLGRNERSITLYIQGETTVTMPDLTNYYSLNAKELMLSMGVQCRLEYQETEEHQPGLVMDQSAEPGSSFSTRDELVLIIAKRPEE